MNPKCFFINCKLFQKCVFDIENNNSIVDTNMPHGNNVRVRVPTFKIRNRIIYMSVKIVNWINGPYHRVLHICSMYANMFVCE